MGGCASVEGLYNKLLGNSLKSYKVGKTDIDIINQKPLSALSECLVIPVFETFSVDPVVLEVEEADKPTLLGPLNKLLEGVVPELKEKRVAYTSCSGIAMNLKHIIFLAVDSNQSFTKDKLAAQIVSALNVATQHKLSAVSFSKLCKGGQIGISLPDVSTGIAQGCKQHLSTPPADMGLQRVFFTSADTGYNNELLRAFDAALAVPAPSA